MPPSLPRRWRIARTLMPWLLLLIASLSLNVQAMSLSSPRTSLAGEIDVLPDPDARWSVEDVAQPELADRFERLAGQPSLGYREGVTWLRMTLERPASAKELWWLEVAAPLLDDLRLYIPTAGGGFSERRSGTEWPIAERDLAYRIPVFELRLPPDAPRTLYLRVSTNNTLALRLTAWTPDAYAVRMGDEQLMFGLFLAVHLVVLLGNFWNFYASRESAYGYLAGFSLVNMTATAASEGFIFQYLMPDRPGWSEPLMLLSWVQALPLYAAFLLEQQAILGHHAWARVYVRGQWAVAALTLALALGGAFQWIMPQFQIWTLACSAAHLGLLIRSVLKGQHEARLLLLGSLVLWAGVLVRFGRNLGWLPSSMTIDYLYLFGMMAHLLVLSYAASRRYEAMRHAKEAAQQRALELSHDSERKLEAQVTARTQALKQALDLAKTALNVERRAQEDQKRFFATVSHELRTPLAVIDATMRNLELDGEDLSEAVQRRHRKIQRASGQLATLVKNCFREDRFEPLNRGARRQRSDLRALLADARAAARLISPQHPVDIDAAALPSDFVCDTELTRLTLRTLAGNAVKYTPPGTRVLLRGSATADGVTIEVIDDGPGVTVEDLPQLFERYYRGQNATGVPGTGLGLPLARDLIQMQGGSLTLDSAPGRGFRAIVWLPVATTPTPQRLPA